VFYKAFVNGFFPQNQHQLKIISTRTKKMNASVKNNMNISAGSTQQKSTTSSDFKSTPTVKPNAPVDLPPYFTGTLFGGKFTVSVLNGTATYLVEMPDGRAASFEGRKGNNKIEAKDWAAGSSVMKSLTAQLQKQKQSITQAKKSNSSQKQAVRQPSTSDGLIPYIPFTPVTPLQIPKTGNGIIDAISSVPNAIWGGTMAAGNGISKGMNGMANIPAAVLNFGVSTAGYIYDSATKKDKNGKTRVDRALHTKLQDLPKVYVRHSLAGFDRIVAERKQKEAQYAADVKKNGAVNTFITDAFATLTPYVVGGKAVTRKATPAPNPQKLLAPAVGVKPQKLLAPAKEQLPPVKNSSVTPRAVWEKETGAGQTSVKSKPIKAPESTPVLQPVTASEALRLKAATMPKHPLSAAKFNSMSLESGDKSFTSSRAVQYGRDTFKAAEDARKSGNFGPYNAKEANEIVAHLKSELARAEARLLPAKTIKPASKQVRDQHIKAKRNAPVQPSQKPAETLTKSNATPVGSLERDNALAANNGGHQGFGSIGIGKQNSIHNMTSHADDGLGGGKGLPQEPPRLPERLPEQAPAANTPKPFAEPTQQTPIKVLKAGKQAEQQANQQLAQQSQTQQSQKQQMQQQGPGGTADEAVTKAITTAKARGVILDPNHVEAVMARAGLTPQAAVQLIGARNMFGSHAGALLLNGSKPDESAVYISTISKGYVTQWYATLDDSEKANLPQNIKNDLKGHGINAPAAPIAQTAPQATSQVAPQTAPAVAQPAAPAARANEPEPAAQTTAQIPQTSGAPSLIEHMSEVTRSELQNIQQQMQRYGYMEVEGSSKPNFDQFFAEENGQNRSGPDPVTLGYREKRKGERQNDYQTPKPVKRTDAQKRSDIVTTELRRFQTRKNQILFDEIANFSTPGIRQGFYDSVNIVRHIPLASNQTRKKDTYKSFYAYPINSAWNPEVYQMNTDLKTIPSGTFYRIEDERGRLKHTMYVATTYNGVRYYKDVQRQIDTFNEERDPLSQIPLALITSEHGREAQAFRNTNSQYEGRADEAVMKATSAYIKERYDSGRGTNYRSVNYSLPVTNPMRAVQIKEGASVEKLKVGTIFEVVDSKGSPIYPDRLQYVALKNGRYKTIVVLDGLKSYLKDRNLDYMKPKSRIIAQTSPLSKYFDPNIQRNMQEILEQRQRIIVSERDVTQKGKNFVHYIVSNLTAEKIDKAQQQLRKLYYVENNQIRVAVMNMADPSLRQRALLDQRYIGGLKDLSSGYLLPLNFSSDPYILTANQLKSEIPSGYFFKEWVKNSQTGQSVLSGLKYVARSQGGLRYYIDVENIKDFTASLDQRTGQISGTPFIDRSLDDNQLSLADKSKIFQNTNKQTKASYGNNTTSLLGQVNSFIYNINENYAYTSFSPYEAVLVPATASIADLPQGQFFRTYQVDASGQRDMSKQLGELQLKTINRTLKTMILSVPDLAHYLEQAGYPSPETAASSRYPARTPTPTTPTTSTSQPSAPPAQPATRTPAPEINSTPQQASPPQGNIRAETRSDTIQGRNTLNIGQRAVDSLKADVITGNNIARSRNRKAARQNPTVTQPTQAPSANRPQIIVHSLNPQDGYLSALNYTIEDIVSIDPLVFLNKYRPSMRSFAPYQLKSLKVGAINEFNETAQFDIDAMSNDTAKNALISARQHVQSLVRNTPNRDIILPLQGEVTTYVVNSANADAMAEAANARNSVPIGHFYREIAPNRQGSARDVTVHLMYKTCNSDGQIITIQMN
jgi:hypothetical protein